jgi:hypothetical protein
VAAPQTASDQPNIVFQDDHIPSPPTSQWQAGKVVDEGPRELTIGADVPKGDYRWLIGLYRNDSGRISLDGTSAGGDRILLGILHVGDDGKPLTFDPAPGDEDPARALYRQHLNTNSVVVDFGPVRTNGSVLIRREGPDWVLRAMPVGSNAMVTLATATFGAPAQITCVNGKAATETPTPLESSHGFWTLPLNGATQYHWPAGR